MIDFPLIKPASITWGLSRNTARTVGIGGQLNRISRTGDAWVCNFTMPPLQDTDARVFRSFLNRASDAGAWVAAGDPSYEFAGDPDLTGFVSSGSGRTLVVSTNKSSGTVPAGSRLQMAALGGVYEVATDAVISGSAVTLTLTVPMRGAPVVGDSVNFHNPRAAFVLDGDLAQWAVAAPLTYSFAFSMTEDTSSNAPLAPTDFPVFGVLLLENGDRLLQENSSPISI
jgi:hypothetical protein